VPSLGPRTLGSKITTTARENMDETSITGIATALEAMRRAITDLARGTTYLSTPEAVELCPFELSEETLLAYPDFVAPRFLKNPRARRRTYLWDPRDIRDLPVVLRRWEEAIQAGPEALQEFVDGRYAQLKQRDLDAMGPAAGQEAA
jgi:hypothetical protein